ncbi:MAG: hypothetical protein KF764_14535 [Labilithrix sp.]|nr:hypothetical protein [Labilithrix sp.]
MDRAELERLDREGLVLRAQSAGIRRARVLTRPELIDELLRLDPAVDQTQLKKSRGFFGVARDLLTRVVERGLHLPDAADRLRAALGSPLPHVPRPEPQAVPTVTLAEIYAAQGHKLRAVETLQRVLDAEPEHGAARALLEKLEAIGYVAPRPPLPPEADELAADEIGAHLGVAPPAGAAAETSPAPEALSEPAREATSEPAPEARLEPAPEALAEPLPEPPSEPEREPPTPRVEEPTTLPRAGLPTECVAIPLDAASMYVWWRLAPEARTQAEDAFFFVRAVVFVPSWDGPQRTTRDVACDPAAGELVLRELPAGAVVRVAIGVMDGGELVPLAHSPALETSPSRELVEWTPDGAAPIVLEDPGAASIARAAEAAARVSGSRRPGPG